MLKKIYLPVILLVLTYGFWVSPDFKVIAAGISIFLFGMLFLERGFNSFTGGFLEKILKRTTDKTWKSLGFGIVSTSLMQSSSLVSVITISFLGAGLIGLESSLGIIFGANIGTTTGAWLVAGLGLKVKISAYAMPLLVFGVILIFQKKKWMNGIGYILAGLGFLFLGIHYMKEGFAAFQHTIDLTKFAIAGLIGLAIFTGIGVMATVIMQSSHATLVLIITALSTNQITYENALALAIGANIGTTITAILGSISSNISGKRLAGGHLIFNFVTGAVALIFINQFIWVVDFLSQNAGIANDDYTMKLAVFHTVFNLVGVIIMLPFIKHLSTFLKRVIIDKIKPRAKIATPAFLSESALQFPDTAIHVIHKETLNLLDRSIRILCLVLNLKPELVLSDLDIEDVIKSDTSIMEIDVDDMYHSQVKGIYNAIIEYTSRAQINAPEHYIHLLYSIKSANKDIVNTIKNVQHIHANLLKYTRSGNKFIKLEYNSIRQNLIRLIRIISNLKNANQSEDIIILIDKMEYIREQSDILKGSVIDNLIREHKITIEMATSLINDSTHAYSISKHLIQVASYLFVNAHLGLRDLNEDVMLNERDVKEILDHVK